MEYKKNRVIGIGGANMDVHMKVAGDYILHDSNPGKLLLSPGGVTRNILENLSRLGRYCSIISAVGTDVFGDAIIDSCEEAGVDTKMVYRTGNHLTSSYLSLIDGRGDMYVAACDAQILETMDIANVEKFKDCIFDYDAVVMDTNWTEEQLKELDSVCKGLPVFIDPVSTEKAKRMKDISGRFYMIKPNRMELEVLSGMECLTEKDIEAACKVLISKGTFAVAVSLGENGCYYADAKGNSFFKEPRKVEEMVNASGAGDAFMAGLVHSFLEGYGPEKTVDTALACGRIAVMSKETINPHMSAALVEENI